MNVKITADSTCDLPRALLEQFDISTVPLSVTLGERCYRDGVDLSPEDIYRHVEDTGILPKSSAVSVGEYLDFFRSFQGDYDGLVHISLSGAISSTCRNALYAAEELRNVFVVDSRSLCAGQGLVALRGAELARQGLSAGEIARACMQTALLADVSFVIDRLDYLHKGGRCAALEAFGANLLHLRPCIQVSGGVMTPGKRYRGPLDRVALQYAADRLDRPGDVDPRRIFLMHTRFPAEILARAEETIRSLMPACEELIVAPAGSVITTHCGPNTLAVMFLRRADAAPEGGLPG